MSWCPHGPIDLLVSILRVTFKVLQRAACFRSQLDKGDMPMEELPLFSHSSDNPILTLPGQTRF